MAALAPLREDDRAALLGVVEVIAPGGVRAPPRGEAHEERHERLAERLGPDLDVGIDAEMDEPRRLLRADREVRIVTAVGAGDLELVLGDGREVAIERARDVGTIGEEAQERLRRRDDLAAAGRVDAPVDGALEMTGLAGEAAESAVALVERRDEGGEDERLAEPGARVARRSVVLDRNDTDALAVEREPRVEERIRRRNNGRRRGRRPRRRARNQSGARVDPKPASRRRRA